MPRPVHNIRDLYRAESGLTAGASVELVVMRGVNMQLMRITPLAPRETVPALSPNVTEKDNLVFRLGVYGATLTPAIASSLGGIRDAAGVLVLALARQSALLPGDVVHGINGDPVDSVESLRKALDGVEEGDPLVVQIERGGMLSYVTPGSASGPEHTPKKTGLKY